MATVLFLHSSSDLYGSDRSLIRTIDAVLELGHSVFVCLPYQGPLVELLRKKGVIVYVFSLGVLRRKYFNLIGVFAFVWSFSYAFFRVLGIVRRSKIRLIHSNTSTILIGGVVSKLLGVSHIWHVREILTSPVFLRKSIHYCLANMSDKIVAVSRSTLDHIFLDQPSIINKALVINNGLEIDGYLGGDGRQLREELGLNENDILVGMIARVSHWKGQDLFLNIAKKTFLEFDNVYFIALGSPFQGMENLMDSFRKEAVSLPVDRFFIHEFSDNVKDYLASFDVFILPSTQHDPLPTTVLEAMATKKAIIVNGHGGSTEMIEHKRSGFIVSTPNDSDEFLMYLREYIKSPELREEMSKGAFDRVNKDFSVKSYTHNIQQLFKQYLN